MPIQVQIHFTQHYNKQCNIIIVLVLGITVTIELLILYL